MNHYCLRAYSIHRLSNLKGPPPRCGPTFSDLLSFLEGSVATARAYYVMKEGRKSGVGGCRMNQGELLQLGDLSLAESLREISRRLKQFRHGFTLSSMILNLGFEEKVRKWHK